MATISKIEGTPYTDKAFVGKYSDYTAYFKGDLSKISQVIWYVQKRNLSQIEDSFSAYGYKDSVLENGVYKLPPTKVKFKEEGDYYLDLKMNGTDSGSKRIYVTVTKEPRFKVSITPASDTIYPEQSTQLRYILTDAPSGNISQIWYVNDEEVSKDVQYNFEFKELGVYSVRCDVTIDIDGFGPMTKSSTAQVTCAKGKLDTKISFSIQSLTSSLERGERTTISAISDHPDGVAVDYTWQVNGVTTPIKDKDFDFEARIIGLNNIQCIASFNSPNYEGMTLSSPLIDINVDKISKANLETYHNALKDPEDDSWGYQSGQTWDFGSKTIDPVTLNTFSLYIKDGTKAKFFIDDVLIEEKSFDVQSVPGEDDEIKPIVSFGYDHKLPDFMGEHKGKVQYTTSETEYFAEQNVEIEFDFIVGKCPHWNDRGIFEVNDKIIQPSDHLQLKVAPKDTVSISLINLIDQSGDTQYNEYHRNLGKEGLYELIDENGDVLSTANDGKITWETPEESQTLRLSLRHTLDKQDIFTKQNIATLPLLINSVDNPIIPPLELEVVQDSVGFINDTTTFKYVITNIPDGTSYKVETIKWFVNNKEFSSEETIQVKASEKTFVYAEASVNVETFTPSVVISQSKEIQFNYRQWPELDLVLTPVNSTVNWGDFLEVSCEITNKDEVIGIDGSLTIEKPIWYLDDTNVESIEDGSLKLRATHPGKHVITAELTLNHPEYEPTTKTVKQSIDITTEKRDMAIILDLTPKDPVITFGESKRFTASITGAPGDSTTTFDWTVDGVKQTSTENFIEYTSTKTGKIVVEVTSTTKATGADDDIKTATTTMTVNNATMDISAVASTTTPEIKLGEDYTVKCDVTGAPPGATVTYKWNSGETTQSVTKASTAIGPIARKCTVTVKATNYDDAVVDSNTVTVQVQKKDQSTKAVVSTSTPTIKQETEYEATVDVTDAPAGAAITYLWSSGETTKDVFKFADMSGQIKLSCKVTVKHPDYEDKVIDTNEVVITVEKIKVPNVSISVTADPTTVKVDDEYTVTAKTTKPAEANVLFEWDSGETTSSITVKATTEGEVTHTCTAKVTHPNYDENVVSASATVKVESKDVVIPEECPILYVHPLPHRHSAYIWSGWWIMDAIEKLTIEGKDWKTAKAEDSKYYCHLNVLAKMLDDFPEVDVQESRNGRIVHRSALEIGIIY